METVNIKSHILEQVEEDAKSFGLLLREWQTQEGGKSDTYILLEVLTIRSRIQRVLNRLSQGNETDKEAARRLAKVKDSLQENMPLYSRMVSSSPERVAAVLKTVEDHVVPCLRKKLDEVKNLSEANTLYDEGDFSFELADTERDFLEYIELFFALCESKDVPGVIEGPFRQHLEEIEAEFKGIFHCFAPLAHELSFWREVYCAPEREWWYWTTPDSFIVDVASYYEGVLDPPRKQAMELHLKECSSCREELERIKELYAATSALRANGRETSECPDSDDLARHAFHEMEKSNAEEIRRHVATCPTCQDWLAGMRAAAGDVREMPEESVVPQDIAELIKQKADTLVGEVSREPLREQTPSPAGWIIKRNPPIWVPAGADQLDRDQMEKRGGFYWIPSQIAEIASLAERAMAGEEPTTHEIETYYEIEVVPDARGQITLVDLPEKYGSDSKLGLVSKTLRGRFFFYQVFGVIRGEHEDEVIRAASDKKRSVPLKIDKPQWNTIIVLIALDKNLLDGSVEELEKRLLHDSSQEKKLHGIICLHVEVKETDAE